MKNEAILSPEELSLKLMAEWFDSVSKEEFLEEFNSLGNNYSGLTIGEFLQENIFLESHINQCFNTFSIPDLEHATFESLSTVELNTINLIPDISFKSEGYHMSTSMVHTHIDIHNKYPKKYDKENDDTYALAA